MLSLKCFQSPQLHLDMVYLFQFFLFGAFFLMQDVSSIYDLFDPKLREISATHHFMTRTTHFVCFKDKKEIGLSYHIQNGNRPKNQNMNEGMIWQFPEL